MDKKTIKIFMVDDHEVTRHGLMLAIQASSSEEFEIRFTGFASSGSEALEKLFQTETNFLMIDVILPDMRGTELVHLIRTDPRHHEHFPILVMTGLESLNIPAILRSGANGYISKNEKNEVFIKAIRALASNPTTPWLSETTAKKVVQIETNLKHLGLTSTEMNLLRVINHSNEEILEMLGINKNTLRGYLSNLYDKLGVHSRGEAINFARRIKLIDRH